TRDLSLSGGTWHYNSTNAYSGNLTFSTGTVMGSGNLQNTEIILEAGKTISPGEGVGTLTTGSETWHAGGSYLWEINNLSGIAGQTEGWDFLNVQGILEITSGVHEFTFQLDSIGILSGWDPLSNHQWTVASASGGILDFNSDFFLIDSNAFEDQNFLAGGKFHLEMSAHDLLLVYSAVPEPHILSLLGIFLGMLWRRKKTFSCLFNPLA
ncbi:MAG: PEP-CTERM sorting domain-containing protein, partial [Verrucomicrobiota bacterium]